MAQQFKDMAIPEMKLVQNVGGGEAKDAGAKPGDFYCALTGEIYSGTEGFEIVVTGRASTERTYWGPDHEVQSDEPPICSSWDGITSVTGDECMTACPYAAFTDAPGLLSIEERKTKCTPGYKVTGINLTNMMPVFIRCSGISAAAARELNTLIAFHKNIKGGQFFKAKFRITSIVRRSSSGEAYAIKFSQPELLGVELVPEVRGLIESLIGEALPELTSPQQVLYESSPADLAKAENNIKAAQAAQKQTQKDPPGTVILDKGTKVPPKVAELGAKVNQQVEKKALPKMDF